MADLGDESLDSKKIEMWFEKTKRIKKEILDILINENLSVSESKGILEYLITHIDSATSETKLNHFQHYL